MWCLQIEEVRTCMLVIFLGKSWKITIQQLKKEETPTIGVP